MLLRLLSRSWRFFQSRNLALVLLGVVTAGVIAASFIPQQGHIDPAAHEAWEQSHKLLSSAIAFFLLDRIYSAWWFFLAVGLLLINTLVCTLTRIPAIVRDSRRSAGFDETAITDLANRASLISSRTPAQAAGTVMSVFRRQGYRVQSETRGGKQMVLGQRGDISQWGSILFHLSFLVLLLGVIWVQMNRYVGSMMITEGQTVTEQAADYLKEGKPPLLGMRHLGFQVRLDRFVPAYTKGGTGTDYASDLVVIDQGSEVMRQTVRVNQPLTYRGISFLLDFYGFAPLIELRDSTGSLVFDAYYNLRVLNKGSIDSFDIPETSLTVVARFFPDFVMGADGPDTRSPEPNNPVLYIDVLDGGKSIYRGPLPLKGSVSIGNDSLSFPTLAYWTRYQVIRDPGKEIVFAGLWLGVIGILLRYLVTQKRVYAVVAASPQGGSTIRLGGTSPNLEAMFGEEFSAMVNRISGVMDDAD